MPTSRPFAILGGGHPFSAHIEHFHAALLCHPAYTDVAARSASGATIDVRTNLRGRPSTTGGWRLTRLYQSFQYFDETGLFHARTFCYSAKKPELEYFEFPDDPFLPAAKTFFARGSNGPGGTPRVERYVPLRRLTLRLADYHGEFAAIGKLLRPSEACVAFEALQATHAAANGTGGTFSVAAPLSLDAKTGAFFQRSLPGRTLNSLLAPRSCEVALERIGALHRDLHGFKTEGLPQHDHAAAFDALQIDLAWLTSLCHGYHEVFTAAAQILREHARESAVRETVFCHGDFRCAQILADGDAWSVIDFDGACQGDPYMEIARFIAFLPYDLAFPQPGGNGASDTALAAATSAYLRGYEDRAGAALDIKHLWRCRVACETARLALATRRDFLSFDGFIQALIRLRDLCGQMGRVENPDTARRAAIGIRAIDTSTGGNMAARQAPASMQKSEVRVDDSYGVADDAAMPFLKLALNPRVVQEQFDNELGRLTQGGRAWLRAIRVTRYKPTRRCLIEYDLDIIRRGSAAWSLTLIGKARARGLNTNTFSCLEALWRNGFDANSADGISVPEPVALIPALQVWLQRKVPGDIATAMLHGAQGVGLARRMAEAIDKLHRLGPKPTRRHGMAEELGILRERLPAVASLHPELASPLTRLLASCIRLGTKLSEPRWVGVHRDFYPDQVIVDGSRLHLLDLDLYAEGDAALDVGNFTAHLVEQGLRKHGDAKALAAQISAMENRFADLSGDVMRARVYMALTLARHVSISTQFPDRRWTTPMLLDLSERHVNDALALRSGVLR